MIRRRFAAAITAALLGTCGHREHVLPHVAVPERAGVVQDAHVDVAVSDVVAAFVAPTQSLVLGFAGDVVLTNGLARRDPFGAVAQWFEAVSATWVNLETVVAERGVGRAANKPYVFLSPPETMDVLRRAGVDGVSLANNHLFDYGLPGLLRTMQLADQAGLPRTGAGRDHAEAYSARRFQVAGRRVAVVGFYRMLQEYPWGARDGVAGLASAWGERENDSVAAVEAAREESDVVVVMVHWGREYAACPDPSQRRLARRWVRAGATMVIGSHPHVLQGVERIGDAWVLYSTGNFCTFTPNAGTADRSAFFEVTAGSAANLRVRPIEIRRGVPTPAGSAAAQSILRELSRRSSGWIFDAEGRAHPSAEPGRCSWSSASESGT
jgi:poly-gamma-glutamate capsule biosynthesis protein CapA/YwtB (metallophosphatase superfamily)